MPTAACAVLACTEPPVPIKTAPAPASAAPAQPSVIASASAPAAASEPPPPALPAAAKGIAGEVRVEEKDGFRWLLINNTVHAAQRVDNTGDAFDNDDPIASLFEGIGGSSSEALVIGLGSGATVSTLRNMGRKVDAVEIEPAVIDFAKKYFGFEGDVTLGDGAAVLKKSQKSYDAIVLDAFAGIELPAPFLEADTLKAFAQRLKHNGFACVRMIGKPTEPRVFQAISAFAAHFPSVRLLGTGVGDVEQHLYLVLSHVPQVFRYLDHPLLWPIPLPDSKTLTSNSGREALQKAVLAQGPRRVRLAGYLIRGEDPKELFLDLPHWEMGSRRYALKLSEADGKKLQALLPPKAKFPTAGDLSTDGDLAKTLYPMMGGGGVKLSTIRFSPVVVAVEGMMLPIPPESGAQSKASAGKPGQKGSLPPEVSIDGATPGRPRAPYIDKTISKFPKSIISVELIHWSIDLPAFNRLRASKLAPLTFKMESAALKADFVTAAEAARLAETEFLSRFGVFWPRISFAYGFLGLREVLAYWAKTLPANATPFEKAKACDWAALDVSPSVGLDFQSYDEARRRETNRIQYALRACAEKNYSIVLKDESLDSNTIEIASKRMVALLEDKMFEMSDGSKEKKAAELTLQAINGQMKKEVKASSDPPPWTPPK